MDVPHLPERRDQLCARRGPASKNLYPFEEELHEAIPQPPDDSEAADRMVRLHRFIAREPPFEKALLLLYLDEKSQKEIAEILGITPTNVSTRINRLKQRIRNEL